MFSVTFQFDGVPIDSLTPIDSSRRRISITGDPFAGPIALACRAHARIRHAYTCYVLCISSMDHAHNVDGLILCIFSQLTYLGRIV